MNHEELVMLLIRARDLLDTYLFEPDGENLRDDVAQVCMAIDDVLPREDAAPAVRPELERSAA
jgi:hypothetical protein